MVELTPETFTCPEHGLDLTVQVKIRLGAEAFMQASVGSLFRPGRGSGAEEFEVVVFCPGGKRGRPHLRSFTGTYKR